MRTRGIDFKITGDSPKSVIVQPLPLLVSGGGEITGHFQIQYTNRGLVKLIAGVNVFTYDIKLINLDYLEDIIDFCCPALEVKDIPYSMFVLSAFTDSRLVISIDIPAMPTPYLKIHTNTILCIKTNGTKINIVTE